MKRQATTPGDPGRRATLQEERRAQAFVSIRMGDLLASDDWTLFERHLRVLRDQYAGLVETADAAILGDALGDTLVKLKWERAGWAGVIRGLDLALGLPAHLRTQAATLETTLARTLDTPVDS